MKRVSEILKISEDEIKFNLMLDFLKKQRKKI